MKTILSIILTFALIGNRFFIEHGWVIDFDKMELQWEQSQ